MEYEKKYRDLVEAVKELQEANPSDDGIQKLVEDNVPELKESGDKMIRKVITLCLEECVHSDIIRDYEKDNALAWLEKQGTLVKRYEDKLDRCACENFNKGYKKALEKQGEQKPIYKIQLGKKYKCIASPIYSTFTTGKIYKPEDKFLCSLMNFCSDCFEPIEDDEQKPCSEDDESILFRTIDNLKFLRDTVSKDPYYTVNTIDVEREINLLESIKDRVQPKQEWSEEDESLRRRCIGAIDMANLSEYTKDNLLNWLKSLKDRAYPKQEWSEEEKARIDKIVDVLDWAEEKGYIRYSDWEDYVCYVKSLRPQSQWKPSGEQMLAINTAINVLGKETINGKYLIELQEQLLKLRDEDV